MRLAVQAAIRPSTMAPNRLTPISARTDSAMASSLTVSRSTSSFSARTGGGAGAGEGGSGIGSGRGWIAIFGRRGTSSTNSRSVAFSMELTLQLGEFLAGRRLGRGLQLGAPLRPGGRELQGLETGLEIVAGLRLGEGRLGRLVDDGDQVVGHTRCYGIK